LADFYRSVVGLPVIAHDYGVITHDGICSVMLAANRQVGEAIRATLKRAIESTHLEEIAGMKENCIINPPVFVHELGVRLVCA
jgi:hypothetical protein